MRTPVRPGAAATMTPLADPGFRRDEQLLQREDELQETAQAMNDASEMSGIDPEAFMADEELQAALARDGSEVSEQQPGYSYMWACIEYPVSSRGINILRMQTVGWQVVKGTDKEAMEHITADGTRKLGDSILLRIPTRRKMLLDFQINQINDRRDGATKEALVERAAKFGIKVVDFDHMTDEQKKRLSRQADAKLAMQAATDKLSHNFRNGTVPGVQPGA